MRERGKKSHGKLALREKKLNDRLSKAVSRDDMKQILKVQEDKRFIQMYEMMYDPVHASKSLSTIARECGVGHMELCDAIRKYQMGIGIVRMSQHVPDIMEDVAIDAKSRNDVCPQCDGVGSVLRDQEVKVEGEAVQVRKVPSECPKCKGKGYVRTAGDKDARKLVFESNGLIGKAPLIAVQNNTLNTGTDGLEELIRMSRKPQAQLPAIDAEIVEEQ